MTRKLRLHDQRDHLILGEHRGRASKDPKADLATIPNFTSKYVRKKERKYTASDAHFRENGKKRCGAAKSGNLRRLSSCLNDSL